MDDKATTSEKSTGKLTPIQQRQVVAWLAMGDSLSVVKERVEEEFGITLNRTTLYANYHPNSRTCGKKWRRFGARVRAMSERMAARIPIAQKVNRLRLLQYAADEALRWRTKSVNEWGEVQEKKIGVIMGAVEQARREMEGDPSTKVNVDVRVNVIEGLKEVAARRKSRLAGVLPAPALHGDNGHDATV